MSHNIMHSVYPGYVKKESVQAEWDEYAANEDWQEGCSGLPNNIRWINHICDDKEDAYDYIEKHDNGWYDQLAVKFKSYHPLKETQKITNMKKRVLDLHTKYLNANNNIHYANVKSNFIGCKCCNSKISREYIKSNYCPICKNDLRPETTLEKIDNMKKAYLEAEKKLKEETKKLSKKQKYDIKWLVKIEYHS